LGRLVRNRRVAEWSQCSDNPLASPGVVTSQRAPSKRCSEFI